MMFDMRETTVIQTGSTALFVDGDAEYVEVMALMPNYAMVKFPSGHIENVCVENIGIGVDEDIIAIYDDGNVGIYR